MNKKLVKIMYPVLLTAIATSAFYLGTHSGRNAPEPETILVTETKVEYRTVEKTVTEYVDKPVAVVEYVKQVKEVPVELSNFTSLGELKQWLSSLATFHLQSSDTELDCDDYALQMQNRALADGYIVSLQIINNSEYNALFTNQLPTSQALHAINSVVIGNDIYFVEPQTNEVVLAAHLD
jgi:hypothetical protein